MSPSGRPTFSTLAAAVAASIGCVVLVGCAVPGLPTPTPTPPEPAGQFKEAPPQWLVAQPADAVERGPWWSFFGDETFDGLARQVAVSNQNVASSAAAYAQAQATLREQRAALWPTLSLGADATRAGGAGTTRRGNTYQATASASWEPDVWSRLAGNVTAAGATAQASAADLASATLSAQGSLAVNYFSLREADAEAELLRQTIEAYRRSLQITQNRYAAGLGLKTDVLQAQTQLANTQSDLVALESQRAQYEHAIAVLVGRTPSNFSLPAAEWRSDALPAVPRTLPSALLQRRPDIAAAQRRVAAANAQVGVARAAFFPSFTFSGQYGYASTRVADLFSSSASAWSLGLSLAQTVFDAGATRARVDQARAGWEQTVATYRQTVLAAFQDVEDQLAIAQAVERRLVLVREASAAADQTEAQIANRYRAGQVGYTDVVTAQVSALSARRTLVQLAANRQTGAVALVQSFGGGFSDAELQAAASDR